MNFKLLFTSTALICLILSCHSKSEKKEAIKGKIEKINISLPTTTIPTPKCNEPYYQEGNTFTHLKEMGFPLKTDSLNGKSIAFYTSHKNVLKDAVLFYNQGFHLMDDCHTISIIDKTISCQSELLPFYNYLYIQIILTSDGALSEYLSGTVWEYIETNTDIIFRALTKYPRSIQENVLSNYINLGYHNTGELEDFEPYKFNLLLVEHIDKVKRNSKISSEQEVKSLINKYCIMAEELKVDTDTIYKQE